MNKSRLGLSVGLAFALASSAGAADAAVLGLYNTGVDVGANDVDNAWSIITSISDPALSIGAPAYADTTNGTFPVIAPYWVANSSTSSWITPFNPVNSNTDPSSIGLYAYITSFDITGPVSVNNSLSLRFAADNVVPAAYVNGTPFYAGPTDGSSQFSSFSSVVATDALHTGENTVTFYVENYPQSGGNPSGLNVQFTASAVPEASTWAMMLIGFAGLGFAGYRKSQTMRTALVAV